MPIENVVLSCLVVALGVLAIMGWLFVWVRSGNASQLLGELDKALNRAQTAEETIHSMRNRLRAWEHHFGHDSAARAALLFYGKPENWTGNGGLHSAVSRDRGKVAVDALTEIYSAWGLYDETRREAMHARSTLAHLPGANTDIESVDRS